MKTIRCFALLACSLVSARHQGAVKIKLDGVVKELHIAALVDRVTTEGNAVTMTWGDQVRAFVTSSAREDMPVDNYYNFTLSGKELSFTTDLSQVGCSCNAALFFTSMPGYLRNGTPAHGLFNPYYCDANQVGGVWCWEHDSMEANRYNMHITPHTCSSPAGAYIESCDRQGMSASVIDVHPKSMCPDSSCAIDTRKPFRTIQRYEADARGERLLKMTNRLVQGSQVVEVQVGSESYLQAMTGAFQGHMVMVFQLWGDTWDKMKWLDQTSGCAGDCNTGTATVTFSDIQLDTIRPTGLAAITV